jgi:hypothetical protein
MDGSAHRLIDEERELRKHGRSNWHKDFPDTATLKHMALKKSRKFCQLVALSGLLAPREYNRYIILFSHKIYS